MPTIPAMPTALRIYTQPTPDGKGVFIELQPSGIGPEFTSPLFDGVFPDFDYTIPLPTGNL